MSFNSIIESLIVLQFLSIKMKFHLIDRVDEIVPGKSAKGVKCVSLTNEIFDDHFPEYPVYPGSLMVESMAQLGGFLVEISRNKSEVDLRRAILIQIEKAKFHHACIPGDQIIIECRISSTLEEAAAVESIAMVNSKIVATANLHFSLRKIDINRIHEERQRLYQLWTRHLKTSLPLL